jgi:enoyl-CoA hydratase
VNEVVKPEELYPRVTEVANMLKVKAPLARKFILQAVTEGLDKNLDVGLNLEGELFGNICATEDMTEGTSAFLEKREPKFKGK